VCARSRDELKVIRKLKSLALCPKKKPSAAAAATQWHEKFTHKTINSIAPNRAEKR
jgi:hypothetical protein